jgi:hypothetical protein
MNTPDITAAVEDPRALSELNRFLERSSAEQRVEWALANCEGTHVLSSSFGAQAAVSLHLLSRFRPDIPVVLVDTGYLFPETYAFVDQLTERLQLNLHVVRPRLSRAWMEARHGKLWEQGVEGIERYNQQRKVEPMQRALREVAATRRSPNARTAAGKSTPSPTGTTVTSGVTSPSTACRITRCGIRATSRSATCTPRRAGSRACARKTPASSDSSASVASTSTSERSAEARRSYGDCAPAIPVADCPDIGRSDAATWRNLYGINRMRPWSMPCLPPCRMRCCCARRKGGCSGRIHRPASIGSTACDWAPACSCGRRARRRSGANRSGG